MASLKEQSQQNTENYEKFLNLGVQSLREGEPELAIENFTKAIEINPNKADAYIKRAIAYTNFYYDIDNFRINKPLLNKAEADYTKAIEIYTNDIELSDSDSLTKSEFYIKRSDCYMALKEYDKAIADCTKAIELEPSTSFLSYTKRAKIYLNLKKYDEAFTDFNKIIELNPHDANAYIKRADAYYAYFKSVNYKEDSNKKWDLFQKALADYTKAIELNPNEADFYIKLADAYRYSDYRFHEYDEYEDEEGDKNTIFYGALNNYTKAIELNPNSYQTYYARANLHHNEYHNWQLHDTQQALNCINDYTKVIELALDKKPKVPCGFGTFSRTNDFYYYRAECYKFLEKYNEAITDYSKYIELCNHNKNYYDEYIYIFRAYCYEKLKEYEKAIADYSKYIEINVDCSLSRYYFRRANCYHHLKKHDEALADYSKAIESKNSKPEYCFGRGELYKELGNYELAFMDFDNAIKSCKKSEDTEKYARTAHDTAMSINDYSRAKNYLEQLTSLKEHKEVYLGNIDKAEQLEKLNQKLAEKNKELNNLIAMFAHNFLGTLQCIRSNAEHDNNVSIHLKTVKMMSGALTAFSIISADDDKLIEQLKQDKTGETTLLQNLANNLALAVSQLLSKTNKDKIINLYLNYLRKTAQIKPETNGEELRENRDYRKKWQALQHQWEDEFNALFSETVELSRLQTWLETNFFPVQIIGFNDYNICFKEYGITDSIFLVVFMEILVNALKYMDVSKNQPLTITLYKESEYYQLTCENPSAQESYRGTHKGMDFLKSIARKINGQFITESTAQRFKSTFIIPAELLE